jgi:hypothetical protein
MQIIYVDRPEQNKETENPFLINGELYEWKVRSKKLRHTSLQNELDDLKKSDRLHTIKYFLIYDIVSINKYFCTHPECQEIGSGCKKYYIADDHALMLRCAKIYK